MTAIVRGFGGVRPQIGRGVFLAENCVVVGDVVIGDESSIWYSTVLRGDVCAIRVGARTNLQDGIVVHVTSSGFATAIGDDCTIGHAAIVHACTIEDHCLIGMGATILDGARIGRGSLVGAGALVTPGTDIPPDSLVLGAPARVVRPVNAREREQIEYGAVHYVELARRYLAGDGESSVG
ncbi:MAG: gamma carbonic anhydrase family protein [Deltaproteobacteria bacterium]|nr:MAG: gamma carbonic anhydrase family protein [Deltaproteobacteria bacterium]